MKQLRIIGAMISQLSYDVFLISLVGYVVLLALESVKPGVTVRYMNLNTLLLVVAVSGAIAVVLPHPAPAPRNNRWYYMGLVLISLVIGFVVFQLTASVGAWAYVVAAACALIVCSTGIMIQADS